MFHITCNNRSHCAYFQKPSNVLITLQGHLKLTDFGLAGSMVKRKKPKKGRSERTERHERKERKTGRAWGDQGRKETQQAWKKLNRKNGKGKGMEGGGQV